MENLGWGLQMTVLGMGLVFALLALLWLLLKVVLMLEPEEEVAVPAVQAQAEAEYIAAEADGAVGAHVPEARTVHGMAAELVAAITIAAMRHRMALRGEAAPIMRTLQPGSQPSRWAAAGRVRQTTTWNPRGR